MPILKFGHVTTFFGYDTMITRCILPNLSQGSSSKVSGDIIKNTTTNSITAPIEPFLQSKRPLSPPGWQPPLLLSYPPLIMVPVFVVS